jgi:hypothetical protein
MNKTTTSGTLVRVILEPAVACKEQAWLVPWTGSGPDVILGSTTPTCVPGAVLPLWQAIAQLPSAAFAGTMMLIALIGAKAPFPDPIEIQIFGADVAGLLAALDSLAFKGKVITEAAQFTIYQ